MLKIFPGLLLDANMLKLYLLIIIFQTRIRLNYMPKFLLILSNIFEKLVIKLLNNLKKNNKLCKIRLFHSLVF